jgi:hypothetical protein
MAWVMACGVAWCGGCAVETLNLRRELAFPAKPQRAGPINVQLIVGDREVAFTNSTVRTIEGATLWLNAWFGARLEPVAPGQSVRVALTAFADENGGSVRGGGFWARAKPEKIVLAELEMGDRLYGLVVVTPADRSD